MTLVPRVPAGLSPACYQSATILRKGKPQAVTQKMDSLAMRLVQEAERQAGAIRVQAESLAATVKRAGYQQAEALTSEAGSDALLQAGAKSAADQLRKETDDKASGIVDVAARRGDSLVSGGAEAGRSELRRTARQKSIRRVVRGLPILSLLLHSRRRHGGADDLLAGV